jgi:hypothetical protein
MPACQAQAVPGPRQSYSKSWTYKRSKGYYFKLYHYRPTRGASTYQRQYVVYKPTRSREWVYWYNPQTKKSGFAKLSGQPMMVESFDKIGIGQWFRYLTGGIEVASAILLVIPRLTPVGAALLVCTMVGAVLTHLLLIGGSPVPALVLSCFAAIILWGRFGTLKAWLGKLLTPAVPAAKPGKP